MTKLYKVTITGWVVQDDFIDIPPSEWGTDHLLSSMLGENIQEVLVDTIENNFDVPLKETPEAVLDNMDKVVSKHKVRTSDVAEVKADYEIFKNYWCSLVWYDGEIVRTDEYTTYKDAYDYALGRAESRYGEEWLEQNKHNVQTYYELDIDSTNEHWDVNTFLAGDEQGGYSICRYSHIPTTITVDWDHLIKGDA